VREVGVFGAFTVGCDANFSRTRQVRGGLSCARDAHIIEPCTIQHNKFCVARHAALWRYDKPYYIKLPALLLNPYLTGMAASRVGLWSFDLIQVKQLQETLANHPRRNNMYVV